ncbi:MAG TPA: FecR domain-containing protein [Pelobium sp.]|nr:FecR domain-containing protein [Pelobium sp.]
MQEEDKYWVLITRYLSNELSDAETDVLLEWISDKPERTELLQQMQSAWEQSNTYLANEKYQINTDEAWKKIESRLFKEDKKPAKVVAFKSYKWLRIAVSLVLFMGLSWFSFNYYQSHSEITFTNQLANKQQVLLPDGSTVWLNTGSKLSYKKGLNELSLREVDLVGEGFFEVKHDASKPFIIHSNGTETQVLGTSFNVLTDKIGNVKVAVITGKVSFKKDSAKDGLFLFPGEVGIYSKAGNITKTSFSNTNFLYWKNQKLSFENEDLSNVLSELEKVYHVKFKLKDSDLMNKKITTSFQSASIYQVINILETLLDVKIEKSNDTYIVVN